MANSREKLINDVYQTICSASQELNTAPDSINFESGAKIKNLDELCMGLDAAKPYLDGFIQGLNHFLYLTSEAELQQTFREGFNGNPPQTRESD